MIKIIETLKENISQKEMNILIGLKVAKTIAIVLFVVEVISKN